MTTLRFETLTMPAADLGPENPLPPLGKTRDPHVVESIPGIPEHGYAVLSIDQLYQVLEDYDMQLPHFRLQV